VERLLGKSGIKVSAMGFGCWAIGGPLWAGEDAVGWGEVDDQESIRALHCGIDLGINFIDTADVYGAGHSERIVAQAVKGKRDKLIIATKFGNVFDESTKQITGQDASAAFIKEACDASLKRLNTDYIDLYQFHNNDYDIEKAAEVRETLEELIKQGKIRWYAWSTDFPDRAELFARGTGCTAIQYQENVFTDNAKVIDICEKNNLAGINRGPLAMGLLSGKYSQDSKLGDKDVRGTNSPSWMQYFQKGKPSREFLDKLAAIRNILTAEGRSLVQGALAWLWARSKTTIPIPGFRTEKQVTENAGAMQFGPLATEQMEEIEKILERE